MKKLSALFLPILLLLFALLGATQLASAANDTWTGATDANWGSTGNWSAANPPNAGDSLIFGSTGGGALVNNLTDGTAFNGLTFNGSAAFTLNGPSSVLLSGQVSGNTLGIASSSSQAQVIGTMPLSLDWGYHTFSSSSGTLALNSTITPNAGGVAYLGSANLTSPLTADGTTGLIPGLNGAGLMYSGSAPTGLATIDGSGNIVAYGAYTTYPSAGAISPGNNIELTATATTTYTASGITVNTIRATTVGTTGGTAVDTVTTTGTLTFGNNGGVYVLDAGTGNKNCLNLTGGSITAGSSGAATLVLAVNGTTPNNQLAVNSIIANNTGGGAVSVVTTGPGSLYFTGVNTYSGGTYINQGQLQMSSSLSALGSGPVYIAGGASCYVLPAGTIANDFYLSPGLGAGSAAAQANQGALNVNSTATLSGTIHLSGAPVPAGPGDRIAVTIATGGTLTISGKITGTGTLDIAAAHSDYCQIGNTANDWSGGLVIGQIASGGNANCYFRLGTSSTSAGPLPHGSGKGDVRLNGPSAASARFDLNGHNVTMNGLNSKGTYPANELVGTYQGGSGTLTLGDGDAAGTFNGMMTDHNISPGFSDVFTLVKIGAGTQTLSPGASASLTYHGSTTVNAGTLALSGANGWPANSGGYFTVASPAILDVTGLTTPATVGVGQTTKWLGTVNGPVVAQGGTICCIGTVNGATAVNAGGVLSPIDHKAGGPLGTMTQHGTMTFAGGGQYAWYINNADHATGTAGTDNGWSWVNNTGGLNITANSSSPFAIKITSFTALDVAGNAANFNAGISSSWPILTSDTVITTFDPTAFTLDTSAFANPMGSGTFSIQLSGDSKSLLLSFAVPPAITAINVNTAGNTVAISGTNGPPNVTYRVLASTDVTAHLNTWSQVGTGTFANDGSFTFNGAINPAGSQRFYAIVLP